MTAVLRQGGALPNVEPIALHLADAERDTLVIAKRIYAARRARRLHFDPALFSDPAWDMLLDLYISEKEARQLSVSALCLGSQGPQTTALRYVPLMCDGGITRRIADPVDARRHFVEFTDQGRSAMQRVLQRF